jgi:PAS domain S-box-containing protein
VQTPRPGRDPDAAAQIAALTLALADYENRFRAFSETSVQGKLVLRAYRPLFANAVAARILGFESAAAVQSRLSILTLMDDSTRADPMGCEAIAMRGLREGQTRWRRRDGAEIAVNFAARPIHWAGQPCLMIAFNDVSALEDARREAETALARSQAALRGRNQLLSAVSHHLRTPMHTMIGHLRMAFEENAPGRARRLACEALHTARRLVIQIDDILDTAALQANAPHLASEPMDLADAIDDALQAFRGTINGDGDQVSAVFVDAPIAGLVQIVGDRRRLARIILALLEEGIARHGVAALTLRAAAQKEGVCIEAAGRIARQKPCIAETANPLDGFKLAAELAQALGGVLCAQRAGEDGIWRARVDLPFARVGKAAPRARVRAGLSVLVVDDHDANRRLLAVMLEALGHEVRLAEDGATALAVLDVAAQPFDLIMMDIMMPVMDGIEATKRIRAAQNHHAATPIVALTADMNPETHARAEEAGVDAVLTKPLEPARLTQTLALLTPQGDDYGPWPEAGLVQPTIIDQVERQHNQQEGDDNANSSHSGFSKRAQSA